MMFHSFVFSRTQCLTVLLIVFFTALKTHAYAQIDTSSFKFPSKLSYKSGIVFRLDNSSKKFKKLNLNTSNNTISGYYKGSIVSYNLFDVEKIKVQKGNEAWFWGLVGATIGTYIANEAVKNGASGSVYILGAIGLGIGIPIGYSRKTYKTIFDNGYFIH